MSYGIRFDWKVFCERNGIAYVERGPNTARGHISIKCPLCADDPSEHMGLYVEDPGNPKWGCFRDSTHRGKNPVRLVKALLQCSDQYARALVENETSGVIDDYEAAILKMRGVETKEEKAAARPRKPPKFPVEIKPLAGDGSYAQMFYRYLRKERGFDEPEAVAGKYDLHYALSGYFAKRLIIPIFLGGKLASWTGRDVTGHAMLRYSTLSDDPKEAADQGSEPALVNIKTILMQQDRLLEGGRTLVIVEGPLDFLKADFYNPYPADVAVTCLFGKPTTGQAPVIARIAKKYEQVAWGLDVDAWTDIMRLIPEYEEMSGRRNFWHQFPQGVDDPGEMTPEEVQEWLVTV